MHAVAARIILAPVLALCHILLPQLLLLANPKHCHFCQGVLMLDGSYQLLA